MDPERLPSLQPEAGAVDNGEVMAATLRSTRRLARGMLAALAVGALGAFAAAPALAAPHPGPAARPLPAADPGPSAAALVAAGRGPVRSETVAAVATARPVVLQGHGDGGGVGLGQWGAYGYAVDQHRTWSWIVGHYYSGTHLQPADAAQRSGDIDVDLSELDAATTTSVAAVEPGARLRVAGHLRGASAAVVHRGRQVTVTATRGDVAVDLPGIGWRDYQGSISIQSDGHTWNVVPLEDYVAGVVPAESPAGWGSVAGGEAALQAQAVATRSYALAYVAADGVICDTTTCQVYLGDPADQGLGSSLGNVGTAVATTSGQVMCTVAGSSCAAGDVAMTQFGASTGGWTTTSGPFQGVADQGDAVAANPYHDWSEAGACPTVFAAASVARDVGLRKLTSMQVVARSGGGSWGGRATEVTFTGTTEAGRTSTVEEPAWTVASMLGLCSTWFRVAGV